MRDIASSRDSPIADRHRTDCGGGMEHRPRRHHASGRRVRRKPLLSTARRNREQQEGDEVDSNEFTVGVGQATYIVLINDASVGPVFGGRSFAPQPRVEVRDAGGNVLIDDSSSAIRVLIYSNPSRGQLSPTTSTVGILQKGAVQF